MKVRVDLIRIVVFLLFVLMCGGIATADLVRPVVGEDRVYVAKEGDTLLSIAKANRLAIEHLAFANGYSLTAVKVLPGTKLFIPGARVLPANPPKDGLVLNVPERGLYRFKNGAFVEFFPVAVGNPPEATTPIGQFAVIEKIKDPTWYPPAWAKMSGPVGPGPNNPLGDRWIGLSAHMVGIHGTNNPINVGGAVTHGCIRCYPEDVRDLFEKVSVGLPVRVEYEVAKLGRKKDGSLHLVSFEDLYTKTKPLEAAGKLLSKVGKESLLNDPNFKGRVELQMGRLLDLAEAERRASLRKAILSSDS